MYFLLDVTIITSPVKLNLLPDVISPCWYHGLVFIKKKSKKIWDASFMVTKKLDTLRKVRI